MNGRLYLCIHLHECFAVSEYPDTERRKKFCTCTYQTTSNSPGFYFSQKCKKVYTNLDHSLSVYTDTD